MVNPGCDAAAGAEVVRSLTIHYRMSAAAGAEIVHLWTVHERTEGKMFAHGLGIVVFRRAHGAMGAMRTWGSIGEWREERGMRR